MELPPRGIAPAKWDEFVNSDPAQWPAGLEVPTYVEVGRNANMQSINMDYDSVDSSGDSTGDSSDSDSVSSLSGDVSD